MSRADLGLIGLAVMGENLALNMESKGFTVAVYNRTAERVTNFVEGRAKDKNIIGTYSLEELVASLKKPRKVMLMVKEMCIRDRLGGKPAVLHGERGSRKAFGCGCGKGRLPL